jgi:hypothetical protein
VRPSKGIFASAMAGASSGRLETERKKRRRESKRLAATEISTSDG